MSRSFCVKHHAWAAVGFAALWLLSALAATPAMAQKKGGTKTPPPPPPPGSVFFEMTVELNTVYGINTDGTSPTNSGVPGENAHVRPSSRVYGTDPLRDRWFLRVEEVGYDAENDRWMSEVFAYHPSRGRVQVTNFNPEIAVPTFGYQWSNGGDAFISVTGFDVTWTTGGQATINSSHIFRLWVTGDDIDAAALAGEHLMLTPSDLRCEVAVTGLEQTPERMYGAHHWSPDGMSVVYQLDQGLEVVDVATGAVTPLFSSVDSASAPQWSPAGDRILFSSARDVYTVAPDGSDLKIVADGTLSEQYTDPFWSPDGTQIAFRMVRASGFNRDVYIVRAPASGGSYTILTGSLDKRAWKAPIGWVGN